jgi:hypothetical protein
LTCVTTHSAACSDAAQSSPATCQIAGITEATAPVASVMFDPVRAVALAGRLIEAALPRLSSPTAISNLRVPVKPFSAARRGALGQPSRPPPVPS